MENVLNELEEAKATGEDSVAADPVAPAGGEKKKRIADKNISVDPKADEVEDTVKTPQGSHDYGLKESVSALFEGQDLSEEFKNKTVAIFEAAIHEKVEAEKAALEESFNQRLDEEIEKAIETIAEQVDEYLSYVAEKWLEENQLAVESGIKVEMAESLMNGLKSLFEDHNIDVSEEKIDILNGVEEKLEEAKVEYNEAVQEVLSLREELEGLKKEIAFNEISEGLVSTQVDRFRTLSEGVSFDSVDEYIEKLKVIKESYFTEAVKTVDQADLLEEEAEVAPKVEEIDPSIAHLVSAFDRIGSK